MGERRLLFWTHLLLQPSKTPLTPPPALLTQASAATVMLPLELKYHVSILESNHVELCGRLLSMLDWVQRKHGGGCEALASAITTLGNGHGAHPTEQTTLYEYVVVLHMSRARTACSPNYSGS